MKKVVWLILGCVLCSGIVSCRGRSNDQPAQRNTADQKNSAGDMAGDGGRALKFLSGAQKGDKKVMYDAADLTDAIVNSSREKLINSKVVKLSDLQRAEYEHALRTSGGIDFFYAKLQKIFPKTADIQIKQSELKSAAGEPKHIDHTVTITYNKGETFSDKTGRPVKTLVVHLQQFDRAVTGHLIHEFSFFSKDFEKIADKAFETVTYFD